MKKSVTLILFITTILISSCWIQSDSNLTDHNTGAMSNTQSQVDSTQLTPNHE